MRGDAARAAERRKAAVAAYKGMGLPDAAALLESTTPPSVDEVVDLDLRHPDKAILLATLAEQHPDSAAAFRARASQLNIGLGYPRQLVGRVLAKKKP